MFQYGTFKVVIKNSLNVEFYFACIIITYAGSDTLNSEIAFIKLSFISNIFIIRMWLYGRTLIDPYVTYLMKHMTELTLSCASYDAFLGVLLASASLYSENNGGSKISG